MPRSLQHDGLKAVQLLMFPNLLTCSQSIYGPEAVMQVLRDCLLRHLEDTFNAIHSSHPFLPST